MYELLDWQIVLITIVASILVQIYKAYKKAAGKAPPTELVQWLLALVSLAMGAAFALSEGLFAFPAFPDLAGAEPLALISMVLAYLSSILVEVATPIGVGTAVYHALKRLFYDKVRFLRV